MRTVHIGERIKGALEIADVQQSDLASAMKSDPGAISRLLSDPQLNGWDGFLLGIAYLKSVNKKQVRQVAQR